MDITPSFSTVVDQVHQDDGLSVDLSIFVPVHNEVGNIRPLMERLYATLQQHYGDQTHRFEVIVVNDGSTDNSMAEL